MKVSGFTVIRNAQLMGYPVCESVRSALPLVDEFVVGIGQSDDSTKDLIASLKSDKIRTFDSHWDTSKTSGGLILSEKTNEALAACLNDWCLYLQADEVLHENDWLAIKTCLEKVAEIPEVEGLLFDYVHFYGSYNLVATSRRWYRSEVRLVRKSSGARSVGDAQSFRVFAGPGDTSGRKPRVVRVRAKVYHYGWVKPPPAMGQKSKLLNRWWHGSQWDNRFDNFAYRWQYGLRPFKGSHPAVMRELVRQQTWSFEPRMEFSDWSLKNLNLWASDFFEQTFSYRIGEYKPYKLINRNCHD